MRLTMQNGSVVELTDDFMKSIRGRSAVYIRESYAQFSRLCDEGKTKEEICNIMDIDEDHYDSLYAYLRGIE